DPVSRYIPAFGDLKVITENKADADGAFTTEPLATPLTVRHLMTHTAGLGYLFDGESDLGKAHLALAAENTEGDLGARIDKLAALPLYEQPGQTWRYSFATDVLGRVVEAASGQSLEAFMKARIFDPLRMADTEFFIDETDFERLATVYTFDETGVLQRAGAGGLSGGPNDQAFGWASGGGGLVSTARDYARFMMMLLNDGALDGARVLSPASVRLMLSDQLPPHVRPDDWNERGMTFGLGGWVLEKPGRFGGVAAPGQYGWGGYYDTYFTISPEDDLGVVVLSQREPGPHDRASRAHNLVTAIAFGALED
ncbi:MAG: serine hydrolase domain-containing protein, partial [Planctomycetota bacterium]